jgi:hypothetical protein
VRKDLPSVIDVRFVDGGAARIESPEGPVETEFIQEFFFLILFRSVLETIGLRPTDLDLCSEVNFCIKGTITAADNLFDDQNKSLLPLNAGEGARFRSILQLLAFERLSGRALQRGVRTRALSPFAAERSQKELLSQMAVIGSLEGSEEHGVSKILEPEKMVDRVHRVRGGALFELAFIVPRMLEAPAEPALLLRAQSAISRLGTAFQIVDDLTDFEFDLRRGSHNLLLAQITYFGSSEEQMHLRHLSDRSRGDDDVVVELFRESAQAVVARGEQEARSALEELQSIGFWFPPEMTNQLVRAIVGMEGVERLRHF